MFEVKIAARAGLGVCVEAIVLERLPGRTGNRSSFFVEFNRARLKYYEIFLAPNPRPTSASLDFLYRYVPLMLTTPIDASIVSMFNLHRLRQYVTLMAY